MAFPLHLFKLLMAWLKFPGNDGLRISDIKTGKCNQCTSALLRNISVDIHLTAMPLSVVRGFFYEIYLPIYDFLEVYGMMKHMPNTFEKLSVFH